MRSIVTFAVALLLSVSLVSSVVAQDATPVAMPMMSATDLGLPELVISYDGSAYTAPAETAAGRYLVTFTNNDPDNSIDAAFFRIPDGMTFADVQEHIVAVNDPNSGEEAFAWILDKTFAGGAQAAAGQTGQAILDLGPGTWVIHTEDSDEQPTPMAELTVTGEMPADLPEPEVTASFTAVGTSTGYAFDLEGTVISGPQLVKFTNKSDQLHFLGTFQTSETLNYDQFMELSMLEGDATPEPTSDIANVQYLGDGLDTPVISAGQSIWVMADFSAGHWNAVCWISDKDGTPHAMEGMWLPFEVA